MTVYKDINIVFMDLVVHCAEAELLSGGTFFDAAARANGRLGSGWILANTGNRKMNGRLDFEPAVYFLFGAGSYSCGLP